MKINILTPDFYDEIKELHGRDRIIFGGSTRYLRDFVRLMDKLGHDVTIYQPIVSPKDKYGRSISFGAVNKNYNGIKVVCLENTEKWYLHTNPSLNNKFNEMSVMADLRIYWTTFVAFPYAVRPCISVCHGIYWDYPNYADINSVDDNRKKTWLERNLYGFSASDVCVSVDGNSKRVVAAMAPGKENRMQIIQNYADCKQFSPGERQTSFWDGNPIDEETHVLYPRRLTSLRGCNEFIRASRDFRDYKYLSVGQSQNEDAEKSLKEGMKSNEHVKFTHVEMDGMEETYRWADISVIPTRACEGTSLSLIESMASGLPIITTPVGGIPELVIPNYNALVCDLQNEDLGQYIDFLAKDKELMRKMGQRNREIALESYDISIWEQKWAQVISAFA
jgi:glycosyltransferase involved in cell wall biosynthesis